MSRDSTQKALQRTPPHTPLPCCSKLLQGCGGSALQRSQLSVPGFESEESLVGRWMSFLCLSLANPLPSTKIKQNKEAKNRQQTKNLSDCLKKKEKEKRKEKQELRTLIVECSFKHRVVFVKHFPLMWPKSTDQQRDTVWLWTKGPAWDGIGE